MTAIHLDDALDSARRATQKLPVVLSLTVKDALAYLLLKRTHTDDDYDGMRVGH